jgi:fructokinase
MDLVTLGEALIDMFPAEIGRRLVEVSAFYPKPGGAPANVAVAAARLGARAAFIGKVGEDIFGHYLAEVLAREAVDTSGVRFDAQARTTLAIIALPDVNTAEFVFYRNPGADTRLGASELDESLLKSTRALHFGSLSLTHEPARSATLRAAEIAAGAGALISFDVNYRPSLWRSPQAAREQIEPVIEQADVLKLNEVELELLTGTREVATAAPKLVARHRGERPRLVVVTLGAGGSWFWTHMSSGFVPPFAVETVDATGCGDSFVAALLVQLVRDSALVESPAPRLERLLRYANAAGAITATRQGVIPALPTAREVDEFMRAMQG